MAKTKASERIRLSNGDVMTLREALDTGRCFFQGVDENLGITNDFSKAVRFVAIERGADIGWDVNNTLVLGYQGKRR